MAAGPQDAPRHAGQVVRRVLLRRNIAIDPETALVSVAVVTDPPREAARDDLAQHGGPQSRGL
jgi:hypothetical protein